MEDLLAILDRPESREPVTRLPNREAMAEFVSQVLRRAKDNRDTIGLFLIDFDSSSEVRRTLGIIFFERIVREAARRIQACLPDNGRAGRTFLEFAATVWNLESVAQAEAIAKRIIDALAEPFDIEDKRVYLFSNVGIFIYPNELGYEIDLNELIRNLDIAAPLGREGHRNEYRTFTAELKDRFFRRLQIDSELPGAIKREELSLHYQPRVDIASGDVVGAEALIRWTHDDLGAVPPAEFIPRAEATGAIFPLTEWALEKACYEAALWRRWASQPISVSVNLPATSFKAPELPERIEKCLASFDLPPSALEIEVTESLMIENLSAAVALLEEFHRIGLKIALDDFGTGYSSLRYLAILPLDFLKIDRSFVTQLPNSEAAVGIAAAITALARSCRLKTVAEGMDTAGQVDCLRRIRCDFAQGFFFSPPLPADQMRELAKDGGRLPLGMAVML